MQITMYVEEEFCNIHRNSKSVYTPCWISEKKSPTNLLCTNGDVSERFRLQLVEGHA